MTIYLLRFISGGLVCCRSVKLLEGELEDNRTQRENWWQEIRQEIRDNPQVEAAITKKLAKISKTYCKICEKSIYGRKAHQEEYHSGTVKCQKCDEEFSKYSEGWFAFSQNIYSAIRG